MKVSLRGFALLWCSGLLVACGTPPPPPPAPDAAVAPAPSGPPRPRLAAYERETLVSPQILPARQVLERVAKQAPLSPTDAYRLLHEAFLGEDLGNRFDASIEAEVLTRDLEAAKQLGARFGETVFDPICVQGAPLPLVRVQLRGWASTNIGDGPLLRALAETHTRLGPAQREAETAFQRAWQGLLPDLARLTHSSQRELTNLGRLTRFVARSSTYRVVVPFALDAALTQELRPAPAKREKAP